MKEQIERRTCNNAFCSKEVEQSAPLFGGSLFNGWLIFQRTDGITRIRSTPKDNGPWDFCGISCCLHFLEGLNEK